MIYCDLTPQTKKTSLLNVYWQINSCKNGLKEMWLKYFGRFMLLICVGKQSIKYTTTMKVVESSSSFQVHIWENKVFMQMFPQQTWQAWTVSADEAEKRHLCCIMIETGPSCVHHATLNVTKDLHWTADYTALFCNCFSMLHCSITSTFKCTTASQIY